MERNHSSALQHRLNDSETASGDAPVNPPFYLTSIWMSGYGIAGDGTPTTPGDVYFATGNSDCNWMVVPEPCPPATTWNGVTQVQESVVRVSGLLTPLRGVFTPTIAPTALTMDMNDNDLGSGGVLVLPPLNGNYLAVAAGKDGRLFFLNRPPTGGLTKISTNYSLAPCWCGPSYFVGSDGIARVVTSHGNTIQTFHVGSTLTLQTRDRKSRTVDGSQAMKHGQLGAPLIVGTPFTAEGSTIEGNGALLADSIVRAKGHTGALWPQDKD
jgi:hypothetical protein